MLNNLLYTMFLLLELTLFIFFSAYVLSLIFSWLKGAPFVPTKDSELINILKRLKMSSGQMFLDLGCGDGRVVRTAVKEFDVHGIGVDINPLLIFYCRFSAKIQGLKNIRFVNKNMLKIDLSKADIIYIYLFPALIEKLKSKLLETVKNGTVIISHGFKINYLSKYFTGLYKGKTFTTYYYKIAGK